MRTFIFALPVLSLLLTATPAAADDTAAVVDAAPAPPPSTDVPGSPGFLRVTSSFWGAYGIELSGPVDGPGFLAWHMEDAVRGSATAEKHARRARLYAVASLGFSVLAAGLVTTDLLTYPDRHGGTLAGWPDLVGDADGDHRSALLVTSSLISFALAIVTHYATYEEIMMSVNAYNADWVGRQGTAGISARAPALVRF